MTTKLDLSTWVDKPDSGRVRFTWSKHCLRDDQTVIIVSCRRLIAAWRATEDPRFVVDNGDHIIKYAAQGALFRPPEISVYSGRLGFTNGRHRAVAALQTGRTSIPVIVDRDNAEAVQNLLQSY